MYSFSAKKNIRALENHNVGQTGRSVNRLQFPEDTTQSGFGCHWHCWGIGLRFLSPVNGVIVQVEYHAGWTAALSSPLTHISRLCFSSFDIQTKLTRAAVSWEHCDGSSST